MELEGNVSAANQPEPVPDSLFVRYALRLQDDLPRLVSDGGRDLGVAVRDVRPLARVKLVAEIRRGQKSRVVFHRSPDRSRHGSSAQRRRRGVHLRRELLRRRQAQRGHHPVGVKNAANALLKRLARVHHLRRVRHLAQKQKSRLSQLFQAVRRHVRDRPRPRHSVVPNQPAVLQKLLHSRNHRILGHVPASKRVTPICILLLVERLVKSEQLQVGDTAHHADYGLEDVVLV
mmetsp:Transcript_28062/g.71113  ORF Transcript_28062/g.71113 Transcript_28062/m.71113 type:complete len:232 (-) Transcript_28062:1337-2032(-)